MLFDSFCEELEDERGGEPGEIDVPLPRLSSTQRAAQGELIPCEATAQCISMGRKAHLRGAHITPVPLERVTVRWSLGKTAEMRLRWGETQMDDAQCGARASPQ